MTKPPRPPNGKRKHEIPAGRSAVLSEDDSKIHGTSSDQSNWWRRSLNAAIKGGASGSIAMVLQVILLMWLRTTVNYQYKHGVDGRTAFLRLYQEGGILRFYRGATLALLTGPISRFGDTASNEGVKELFGSRNQNPAKSSSSSSQVWLPVWAMTLTASLVASLWRVTITPLDTIKTTLQVGSNGGSVLLREKIRKHGILVLWDGALGNSLATLVCHYPWFIVHNFLEERLSQPTPPPTDAPSFEHRRHHRLLLLRRAFIGFCSSLSSDCVSNGIRVVKTYQQTSAIPISYRQALMELLEANGPAFVLRGLRLKILSNGLSGILFALLWKMILEHLNHQHQHRNQRSKTTEKTVATAATNNDKAKDS